MPNNPSLHPKDIWDLIGRTLIVGLGMGAVAWLAHTAICLGFNGVMLSTAMAVILGLGLAFLGVKVKDVLFK